MNKTDSQFSVLFDTSFLIRLTNRNDVLHNNAYKYFEYFLNERITCMVSTIAIAEYCVKGRIQELPLENLQIVPFVINHAIEAGRLCSIVLEEINKCDTKITPRSVIPNDTKMFAQANTVKNVKYFVSSDTEASKIFNILKNKANVHFDFLDINIPHTEKFGLLFD